MLYAANTFSTNDYMNYVNVPIDQWSPAHRGNFNSISWQDLRFIEATRLGLILKPSDIKNRFAGTGVFAARQIQKRKWLDTTTEVSFTIIFGEENRLQNSTVRAFLALQALNFESTLY